MTKENCERLLKVYEENGNVEAYEDMKRHMSVAKKFKSGSVSVSKGK